MMKRKKLLILIEISLLIVSTIFIYFLYPSVFMSISTLLCSFLAKHLPIGAILFLILGINLVWFAFVSFNRINVFV
ncbi:MAG: hypothetical protein ACYSUK_06530, partial [Planctomycetota bacterium]